MYDGTGGMAEWFKAAVLKTVDGETRPGVRIPLPPPCSELPLRLKLTVRVALVVAAIWSVSCGGVHKVTGMFHDFVVIQTQLVKVLGYNDIRVKLMNGAFLKVEVVNSPLQELPAEQRKAKAMEIARLAFDADPSRSELKSVSVAFAIHRSNMLGFFNYDNSGDAFSFEVADLVAERAQQ